MLAVVGLGSGGCPVHVNVQLTLLHGGGGRKSPINRSSGIGSFSPYAVDIACTIAVVIKSEGGPETEILREWVCAC